MRQAEGWLAPECLSGPLSVGIVRSPAPPPSPTPPWHWGHLCQLLLSPDVWAPLIFIIYQASLDFCNLTVWSPLCFLNCSKNSSHPTGSSYNATLIPIASGDGVKVPPSWVWCMCGLQQEWQLCDSQGQGDFAPIGATASSYQLPGPMVHLSSQLCLVAWNWP